MTPLDWLAVAAAFTAEQLVDVPADAAAWWAVLGGAAWTLWAFALRQTRGWLVSPQTAAPLTGTYTGLLRGVIVVGICFVAMAVPPAVTAVLAWQSLPTACGGEGASPEALLLASLRGILCGLLTVGTSVGETRLAMATTLFMVVLATIVNDHPATGMINAGYAVRPSIDRKSVV